MGWDNAEKGFANMLQIKQLTITRGTLALVSQFSICIQNGEVLTLSGVSGSGKSTVLDWIIGNLDTHFSASGSLWLNGVCCDTLPTEARHIGLLFQDDVLFAHLSVGQNLAFALPARHKGKKLRRQYIEQTLQDIGLAGFHDRDPATLSGGQRARVSLMRTLLSEPQALLLDEPFSKLDTTLRSQSRALVFAQIALKSIPTLLVTHDPADIPAHGRVINLRDWQPPHV
jgi:putative thiamine transport system ATP-binding protein